MPGYHKNKRYYRMGGEMEYDAGGKMPSWLLEKFKKKSMAMGGEVEYGNGGRMYHLVGGETDPTKKVRSATTTTVKEGSGAEYTSNEGMQEAKTEGAIASYNKQSLLDGKLSDSEYDAVMGSDFGKTYLQGATKDNIGDVYRKNYLTKVDQLFENSPDEALAQVNRMAKTNKNFATKLEGKSDEEKLAISKQMMSDGMIGDFHGTILDSADKTYNLQGYKMATPAYGASDFSVYGYKPGENVYIGRGMDRIAGSGKDLDSLLYASQQAGVDLRDADASDAFLSNYFSQEGVAKADAQTGLGTGAYNDYVMGSNQDDFFGAAIDRGTGAKTVMQGGRRVVQPGMYGGYKTGHASSSSKFQEERAGAAEEQAKAQREQDKEDYIQTSIRNDRRAFTDDYFKKNNITASTATEKDYMMAERAFDRSQRAQGGIIYGDGGRMGYFKKKKDRQGGHFFKFGG